MYRKNPKSRGLKIGGASLAFTVLFVVCVIIVNTVFGVLANSMLWYIDMTGDSVFTLSDEAKDVLSDVTADVGIYFAQDADKLMSGEGSSPYMKYIYNTALQLEKEFSNIHVECVDVIKDPAFFDYYYNTAATDIKSTSVVIESGGEFRLQTADSFFMWDENYTYIWGYNGEAKFAASILQVTAAEMPIVYFTSGHGEKTQAESSALWNLYETAGFEVRSVDLTIEDLHEDGRILVINDPVYDFAGIEGGEGGNEIDKIDAFLDRHGSLMVFADSENSKNLKNLSELLGEWGIAFRSGEVITDTLNSITNDGKSIVAKYETEDTMGRSLYRDIANMSTPPKTVFRNAMPLDILFEKDDKLMGSISTSTVFYSGDSSESLKAGEPVAEGALPIMTVSREEGIKDNDFIYTYVLVCGSPEFASNDYLTSSSYANSDILVNTVRLVGREKIVADIDPKVLDETALDITTAQANRWSVAMVTVIPVVVAAVGIFVCIRRRRT